MILLNSSTFSGVVSYSLDEQSSEKQRVQVVIL